MRVSLACGGSGGTGPTDMSVAGHEQAAGAEDAAAEQHGAHYDPTATAKRTRCFKGVPCWTSVWNPTAQHRIDMERHRELADEHRAAARVLRDAEAKSCAGVADADRDTSPFYHREDIARVAEIRRQAVQGSANLGETRGGTAVLRAVPGLTAEWLQRLVDCHRARAASVGYAMPEMGYCPLALRGVEARVTSTGDGFAVDVTSEDPAVAAEVWQRMKALAAAP